MILMDVKLHNLYSFRHFHLNLSYPKKIVNSYIPEEHLPGRPSFRYKKAVILMGPNASGKTILGRGLTGIFTAMQKRELEALRSLIEDPGKEAKFSIDFILDRPVLYRLTAAFQPDGRIAVSVLETSIGTRDTYEKCAQRLDQTNEKPTGDVARELEKIQGIDRSKKVMTPERVHIQETVLKVLDPTIESIAPEGQVVPQHTLSSGTIDGIRAAGYLADILCGDQGFHYFDDPCAHIDSEVEKALLATMIDNITDYGQMFYTTHNTDVLSLPYPKHTFLFLKRNPVNLGEPITVICASDYLKRNTDSLSSAVENDLFAITPDVQSILALGK